MGHYEGQGTDWVRNSCDICRFRKSHHPLRLHQLSELGYLCNLYSSKKQDIQGSNSMGYGFLDNEIFRNPDHQNQPPRMTHGKWDCQILFFYLRNHHATLNGYFSKHGVFMRSSQNSALKIWMSPYESQKKIMYLDPKVVLWEPFGPQVYTTYLGSPKP